MDTQTLSVIDAVTAPTSDPRPLVPLVARFTPHQGSHQTAIPGLQLHRFSAPTGPIFGLYQPLFSMVVQGTKQISVAGEQIQYDQDSFLVTSVDLPVVARITDASAQTPYLCLSFTLSPRKIAELMQDAGLSPPQGDACGRGFSVGRLTSPLADAVLRLVRLLETPGDIPILLPLIEREICYRLLHSNQAWNLCHITVADSRPQRIAKAIEVMRNRYAEPLGIEELAAAVNMSASSLHHRFKEVTGMTPMQYQKNLRLREARRLMLAERQDTATAAHRVGYESPSQFSRDYGRLFGNPPARDIVMLRLLGYTL
ncbi:MAG: AraC family transcriptional regulator [Telmatospirillum sp.]|nr:AraC family transcriptional regulator [Telmatospirillum sp.]